MSIQRRKYHLTRILSFLFVPTAIFIEKLFPNFKYNTTQSISVNLYSVYYSNCSFHQLNAGESVKEKKKTQPTKSNNTSSTMQNKSSYRKCYSFPLNLCIFRYFSPYIIICRIPETISTINHVNLQMCIVFCMCVCVCIFTLLK